MKKAIRITESELKNIIRVSVEKAINENQQLQEFDLKKAAKNVALDGALAATIIGTPIANDYYHRNDKPSEYMQMMKGETSKALKAAKASKAKLAKEKNDTISWKDANKKSPKFESILAKVVNESIHNYINNII